MKARVSTGRPFIAALVLAAALTVVGAGACIDFDSLASSYCAEHSEKCPADGGEQGDDGGVDTDAGSTDSGMADAGGSGEPDGGATDAGTTDGGTPACTKYAWTGQFSVQNKVNGSYVPGTEKATALAWTSNIAGILTSYTQTAPDQDRMTQDPNGDVHAQIGPNRFSIWGADSEFATDVVVSPSGHGYVSGTSMGTLSTRFNGGVDNPFTPPSATANEGFVLALYADGGDQAFFFPPPQSMGTIITGLGWSPRQNPDGGTLPVDRITVARADFDPISGRAVTATLADYDFPVANPVGSLLMSCGNNSSATPQAVAVEPVMNGVRAMAGSYAGSCTAQGQSLPTAQNDQVFVGWFNATNSKVLGIPSSTSEELKALVFPKPSGNNSTIWVIAYRSATGDTGLYEVNLPTQTVSSFIPLAESGVEIKAASVVPDGGSLYVAGSYTGFPKVCGQQLPTSDGEDGFVVRCKPQGASLSSFTSDGFGMVRGCGDQEIDDVVALGAVTEVSGTATSDLYVHGSSWQGVDGGGPTYDGGTDSFTLEFATP